MKADNVTEDGQRRVLADGNEVPLVGLGVWQVRDGKECEQAVNSALEVGYRHIDTAQIYGNERSVGRALRDSGLQRDEVFITTKFDPGKKDPEAELQRSLERLELTFVDLYIVHWPKGGATWTWEGMERANAHGLARSIGVSNFSASDVEAVLEIAEVPPVINQVQFSPFEFRRRLLDYCGQRAVALEAYSPLGTGRHLANRQVSEIAERTGTTPAQVLIRWSLQRGLIVLPKSVHRERIETNFLVFDIELSDHDMEALDRLDHTEGTDRALERPWW